MNYKSPKEKAEYNKMLREAQRNGKPDIGYPIRDTHIQGALNDITKVRMNHHWAGCRNLADEEPTEEPTNEN